MPYAIVDVVVDRPIRLRPGAVAKVRGPASQNLIQPIPHLCPRSHIARYQKISHFLLDARYALLGRTCSRIPLASLPVAMWPQRVTQEVETFLARLLDVGFRLIQSEPQSHDHLPRPFPCLLRLTAAQNHEVVRVVDHASSEWLSPLGIPDRKSTRLNSSHLGISYAVFCL